ncbi:Maltose 6'-phosphate phosphatase [Candidatus Izimaplasma bacterium HR1]|jgi:maltose 6'-phosphate phosphatase|uniref:endonuclease/exonuclease/phosphatase family protein n=1 Tax=Candidatus Izimoplasma sp. HR1 TaxID=1541959 RepID=UPI0004F65E1A|nr:Maltose 6'-phosphate phosphatase [Candidatus Izimaplasma bacterium HR1]
MRSLKLLTLNLHCLEEDNIKEKQIFIIEEILKKDVDIIFLQEVAQYTDSKTVYENVKESNYGYQLQQLLKENGKEYYFYFDTIKHSFDKYDEGVAILSKHILYDVKGNYISKSQDYDYWRTRKMIKGDIHRLDKKISLVSAHLGWSDKYEVFEDQIDRLLTHVDDNHVLLIAGDFNVSPKTKEYSYIINRGLSDLFGSNPKFLFEPTHIKDMDLHKGETRIDYLFANMKLEVLRREVLFNKNRVSDHYGVYIEIRL